MITITWHLLALILTIIIGLIFAATSNKDTRGDNVAFWMVLSIVAILIYGGVFWW